MKNLVDSLQQVFSDPEGQDLIEQTVTAIIKDGNVELSDKHGKNVLFYAIESGNADLVNKILAAGSEPDKKDFANDSALMFAITSIFSDSDNSIVKSLLENRADVNAINNMGETPLTLALELERKSCIKLLLTHGATIPPGYNKRISNAELLPRFGDDNKLIRIVIWGEPEQLQEYLSRNQQLSAAALNNAIDAINALRNIDKREPERTAAIKNELENFKNLKYQSWITSIYRIVVDQWQKIKNFFDRVFFKAPEVKIVTSKNEEDLDIFAQPIQESETTATKNYVGNKRRNILQGYNKENEPENTSQQRTFVKSKRREY